MSVLVAGLLAPHDSAEYWRAQFTVSQEIKARQRNENDALWEGMKILRADYTRLLESRNEGDLDMAKRAVIAEIALAAAHEREVRLREVLDRIVNDSRSGPRRAATYRVWARQVLLADSPEAPKREMEAIE